jgi:glycosyltransferase involved in cell wall biosynthesis
MRQPILTIFYQFDPLNPTIGGIQTCIRYIIKYAPREFDLRIVGITSNRSIPVGKWHRAELFGRKFRFMPLFYLENDNVRGLIPTTIKYTLALLKHKVTSDFFQFHRIEPAIVALQWSGRKILYIHNDIYQEVKGGNAQGGILWRHFPWAYFALEKLLVSQFDRIFSCNSDSATLYRQRYPAIAERVSYLTNTTDSDLFYPLSFEEREKGRRHLSQKLNLAEETRFILFAGRLHPQKDPLLLLQSIAALNELNVHLLIVGEGELKDDICSEIDRLNISDRVTLVGSLTQTELADLYRICHVFVLTSLYEGLARGSIEALACGTPVVTTRAGETPKFLSADGGIVCDERTPVAIASALKQVLHHPEQYSSEACVRIAKPFDAKSVVTSIYTRLLQGWNPPSQEVQSAEVQAEA